MSTTTVVRNMPEYRTVTYKGIEIQLARYAACPGGKALRVYGKTAATQYTMNNGEHPVFRASSISHGSAYGRNSASALRLIQQTIDRQLWIEGAHKLLGLLAKKSAIDTSEHLGYND